MSKIRIPSVIAIVIGVVMAIWGRSFQKPIEQQTDGDFILSTGLMVADGRGVLIAMIACFSLGRSSKP